MRKYPNRGSFIVSSIVKEAAQMTYENLKYKPCLTLFRKFNKTSFKKLFDFKKAAFSLLDHDQAPKKLFFVADLI